MPKRTANRVATFVQISDLHIGSIDPETQNAHVPSWLGQVPWFDGLRGHDGASLVRLEKFFAEISERENAQLIVTGDVTACGNDDEYDTARTFIGGDLQPPKGEDLGLRVPNWSERAVPGNHDHWSGAPIIFGGPPPQLWRTYKRTPYILDPISLSNGFTLRFFGINTDADVRPVGLERLLAQGSFRSELTKIDNLFKVPQENREIRILLLHHSSRYRVSLRPELRMISTSRDALYAFMAKLGISILLCGHTHIPHLEEFSIPYLGVTHRVFEACCGATTILTCLPFDSTSITGTWPSRPKWIPNSLLVHRVTEVQGRAFWHTQIYLETSKGFKLPNEPPYQFPGYELYFSIP